MIAQTKGRFSFNSIPQGLPLFFKRYYVRFATWFHVSRDILREIYANMTKRHLSYEICLIVFLDELAILQTISVIFVTILHPCNVFISSACCFNI